MGSIKLWFSHNQLFNVLVLFFFLEFSHITCLHSQLCTQEQTSALLQFKRQFSLDKLASLSCEFFGPSSYPKTESWNFAAECCSGDGVECDNETAQVIGLHLDCSWLQGFIHPNSSLFQSFPHLQRLNLAFNHFGHSGIPSEFGRLTKLTHLNLSQSSISGQVPDEFFFLSKLVSLDLSYNDFTLDKRGFQLLVQNLTEIEELNLGFTKTSTIELSSLQNLTSLTSLSLQSCGLLGEFPGEYSTCHTCGSWICLEMISLVIFPILQTQVVLSSIWIFQEIAFPESCLIL